MHRPRTEKETELIIRHIGWFYQQADCAVKRQNYSLESVEDEAFENVKSIECRNYHMRALIDWPKVPEVSISLSFNFMELNFRCRSIYDFHNNRQLIIFKG